MREEVIVSEEWRRLGKWSRGDEIWLVISG